MSLWIGANWSFEEEKKCRRARITKETKYRILQSQNNKKKDTQIIR